MAMSNFWGQWTNDIDWDSVSDKGRKLSQSARRNLIVVSAICAIGGTLSAGVALIGSYAPRASYCDPKTNPCTQVETDANADRPINIDVRYLPGFGLQRTAASVLATLLFGSGLLAIAKAEEEQEEIEPQLQIDEQIKIKKLELEANAELVNLENLAETKVRVHEQELKEAEAEMFFERNPEAIAQYLPKPEPVVSQIEPEKPLIVEEINEPIVPEPEPEKIPPGIEIMLNSDLREIVDAGILNLVGAQGSGKTTTSCMLVRYRVWKGHKLIIINPHKRKTMYRGLESYLLRASEFYGVGVGDIQRAQSLMDGLERVLELISTRYDQYQNMLESDYDHFPVTILLEESAEYEGLLSVFNRPSNPKENDPGFSAKRYLTQFWKKFFISTRKANCFGLRTLQFDSNTMNGTEGMAELIKSQGACTLTQYSVPDGSCDGGWRSTGEGEIKIPNMRDADGKPIESKQVTVPTWFDYKKVLEPTDFRDLAPILFLGEKVNVSTVIAETPAVEELRESALFENIPNTQHPTPNTQHPMPNTQSHDSDISPDEMLQRNLDRVLAGLERGLVQPVNSRDANLRGSHPEIEVVEEQHETLELQSTTPALSQETAPTAPEKRYTPKQFSRTDLIAIVSKMLSEEVSQTKIVEQLWEVQKSRSGWSKAYREFRSLGL